MVSYSVQENSHPWAKALLTHYRLGLEYSLILVLDDGSIQSLP